MRRELGLGLFALTAACASGKMPATRTLASGGNEVEISRIIEAAVELDGRGEPADSLYAPYATIIADGRLRRVAPRFAGVSEGGQIAITNTQLQSRGTAAWADVEYRWISDRSNRAQVGRASFVLAPAQGRPGWWIVQAHSSTVR
jgi:hypothetical protein